MFQDISMRLFGRFLEPYIVYFEGLNTSLKRGSMKFTTKEYLSMLLTSSLIAFMVSVTGGSFFITIAMGSVAPEPMLFSYTLAIIISLLIGGSTFLAGFYYPNMKAGSMKTRIDRSLPFAVFFMATAASSGIQPIEIFKTLSKRHGVIGDEAKKIHTGVKAMGMNLTDAMAKVANRSPSSSFADLLWGMISVMTTGGSLENYLDTKTRSFMTQYRLSLNDYAKKIALYTEIYITLVMVGSLFFIVLTAIMSPLGGMDILMLQTFVIFFITPLVSVAYIVLLKGSSPMET